MYLKCNDCSKEFNLIEEGYLGHPDLDDNVECNPFMKLAELCGECYKRRKRDAESISTDAKKRD